MLSTLGSQGTDRPRVVNTSIHSQRWPRDHKGGQGCRNRGVEQRHQRSPSWDCCTSGLSLWWRATEPLWAEAPLTCSQNTQLTLLEPHSFLHLPHDGIHPSAQSFLLSIDTAPAVFLHLLLHLPGMPLTQTLTIQFSAQGATFSKRPSQPTYCGFPPESVSSTSLCCGFSMSLTTAENLLVPCLSFPTGASAPLGTFRSVSPTVVSPAPSTQHERTEE